MIDSITIEGFESHEKTKLRLCKGVNVVIGKSDKGKSAIVRSEKLVNQNTPKGEAYKNDTLGKKDVVRVTNTFNEGSKISIERKNGKNQYRINKDKEPLKALNGTVPEEIQSITRMKPINIQGQHPTEQYFLLADSPGIVAKKFNEVVGISIMDKALSKTNSMSREANSELKIIEIEIQSTKEKVKHLKWAKKAFAEAEELKRIEKTNRKLQLKHDKVELLITLIKSKDAKLKQFEKIKKALKQIDALISIKKNKTVLENQKATIKNTVFKLNKLDSTLSDSKDIDNALKQLKMLLKTNLNRAKEYSARQVLTFRIKNLKTKNTEIEKSDQQLKITQSVFDNLFKTQACPTCGRKG